jgi:ABC-type dipeptide/oligopeptide/nickel transport system permease subunit
MSRASGLPPAGRPPHRAGLALVLLVMAVLAIGAPGSGADPNDTAVLQRLRGPNAAHWLGTDELGATSMRASCTAPATR